MLEVTLCEAPEMVKVTEEQAVVAAGQNCARQPLPEGVMLVLLGTSALANEPVASKEPEITCEMLKGAPCHL